MPKRVYNIKQFHGGINNGSDPRDIAENELVEATNVMVDKVGRITPLGYRTPHSTVDTNTATNSAGRGLFKFSHDRLGAETSATGAAETGDDYLVLTDAATTTVDIWSKSTDNWGTAEFDLGGATSGFLPSIYQADGALRVCDGEFANSSTSKWFGYIDRTVFGDASNATLALDGWYTEDQEIKAGILGKARQAEADGSYPPSFVAPTATAGYLSISVSANKSETGGMRGFKNYYYSLIYDGVQESKLFWMRNTDDTGSGVSDNVYENATKKYKVYIHPEALSGGTNNPGLNYRCTGAKIYWKKVDSAYVAYDDAYLLLEVDFVKGVKSSEVDTYVAWENLSTGSAVSGAVEFVNEPRFETYRSQTGFQEDVISLAARYKTSVVTNRVTYIGNIKAKNKESPNAEVVMGDAMIKSPVNQFDSFPTDRIMEVTIRDGDEIVHLAEYADRLLQFKKNKLYIINISQEIEFLEAVLEYKGVNNPGSVARTDIGIVWANQHGCFFYDGEKVSNLLEKGGIKIISDSAWNSFLPSDKDPMVGYNPNKRQVIVADAVDADGTGAIFLYDFVTRSWVKGSAGTIDDLVKSNFVNDWDGKLIYHTGSTTRQWNDEYASDSMDLQTRDIDFGEPSVKKNIYKVYVSYKGDGSTVTIGYRTNGETSATASNFYKITSDGSSSGATDSTTPLHSSSVGTTDWLKAELKPVSSIRNINSIQLVFGGTITTDFEINDISIVYRAKNVR